MFIQTEDTSNPETLRFLPGRPVAPSGPVDFANVESSIRSPLAQRLLRIEGDWRSSRLRVHNRQKE